MTTPDLFSTAPSVAPEPVAPGLPATSIALKPEALLDPALLAHADALDGHPDFRILRRFVPKSRYNTDRPAKVCRGVVVDTETTGVDLKEDKLIELGMILFEYCPETGRVFDILNTFNALEDPGMPIPEGATKVNGITDEMVAGHKINDAEVEAFLENVELVIAHNAHFDRHMVEKRFPLFMHLAWGCSFKQVDWETEGFSTRKLDYLAYRQGFFYDAHRAVADCQALLEVLQRPLLVGQGNALKQILDNYHREDFRIWALDAKFDKKDVMKSRGYYWGDGTDGKEKAWFTEVSEDTYDEEIAWLKANVYDGRQFRVAVDTVGAFNRFSPRLGVRATRFCS